MKTVKQWTALLIAVVFAISGLGTSAPVVNAAVNDYVNVTKTVNPSTVTTLEEAEVTLNITGTPPVGVIVPNDVVLVIDKSGSMLPSNNNGEDKMTNAKDAAKAFVDMMDMTKHRVAVVDFSSKNATTTFAFSTDKDAAKNYISGIRANGGTATGDAVETATSLLADHRPEAQPVIILMTDGAATEPTGNAYNYAKEKAQLAKDAGIIFYTIALLTATDNPDTSAPNVLMKEMATTANHHHFVLGSVGLNEIYAAIVKEIGLASAYDVTVTDVVDPNFEIVPGSYDNNIPKPDVSGNTLTWHFNELKNSVLSFTYKIRPVSKTKTGALQTSTSSSVITYKDYAGATRSKAIPSAKLTVKLPAPEITSIVQPVGHPSGGETVTIEGKYFVTGATVQFGTKAAKNVVVVSDTQITATVPQGAQGEVNVTVTNLDAQKAIGKYQYKADPIVTSLTPANGPLAGGTTVIVSGNYLMSGVVVKFGDQPAPVTMYSSPAYIKVQAPAGLVPGPVNVTFTNPDGTSVVVTDGYTYDTPPSTDPEIARVNPNTGLVTGNTIAYIEGKNFKKEMKVLIGGKEVTSQTFNSSTQIKITIPAGDVAGAVDVSVVDATYKVFTLPNAYTYTAIVYPVPTISAVTPNTGLIAGGDIIFVDGTDFVNNVSKIYIDGQEVPTTFVSKTRLRATVPAVDSARVVDVKVVNDTHEVTLPQAYTYTEPVIVPITITGLAPNTGLTTGGTVVYITGTNFTSKTKVFIGSTPVTGFLYVESTRIRISTPPSATAGKVDVTAINEDGGTGVLEQAFEYTEIVPTIKSLSPSNGNKAGGDLIYVYGTNFDKTTTVTINGVSAGVTYVSGTTLKVVTPASLTIGEVPLVVALASGTSATATFTYDNGPVVPAPAIKSIAPTASGLVGDLIYISGSDFQKTSSVFFGTTKAVTVTYVSSTSLKVIVPAGTLGPVDLKVVNPDGQESNAIVFTYISPPADPAPTITRFSSTSGIEGDLVYIYGTNFKSKSTIFIGNTQATRVTYQNSTTMKVFLPAATAGPIDIKVVNPDGQESNSLVFTYTK